MKKVLTLVFLFIAFSSPAQILDPVKWSFSFQKVSSDEADLLITAKIEPGWHVYSQFIEEGGGLKP